MSENTTKPNENKKPLKIIDYSKVDLIIKKNPQITWIGFQKECPIKMSEWTFYDRKKFIIHGVHFGDKDTKKEVGNGKITVAFIMENCAPKKSELADDYEKVARILLKNPDAIHSHLKKKNQVKMCDANFYQFRKKIKILLNGKAVKQKQQSTSASVTRRKKGVYTLLFEKEIGEKGMSEEARIFLNEFLEELNKRKSMDLEVIEIISPRHVLEVRSY